MTSPLKRRAASKSSVIEGILRQHGTLPVRRIVQEMQLMGVEAKPRNVSSLMSTLFKRFASPEPGLWQIQDPALSHAERVIAYEESRGREVTPDMKAFLESCIPVSAPAPPPPLRKLRATPVYPPPTIKAYKTLCRRCFKKDVVSDTVDDWSICLNCGCLS